MIAGLAAAVIGRRRWVLAATVLLAGLALSRIGALKSDFTLDDLFADAGDQRRITREFREVFGNTDNSLLVVVTAADVTTPPALEYLAAVDRAARKLEAIGRVDSLASIRLIGDRGQRVELEVPVTAAAAETIGRAALSSPLIRGRLIAADRSVSVAVLTLADGYETSDAIETAVSQVEGMLAEQPRPGGVGASLGGLPYVRATVVRNMNSDQLRLLPIGFALCLVILFFALRWIFAVIFPLVTVGISAALVVGGMAWVGAQINVVNNIVPLLILIIGVSDSIHLIGRYTEELANGLDPRAACEAATRRMVVACFLTSFTTAVGFASLLSSATGILRNFGLLASIGVLVAFAVTITFLPASLASVGPPRIAGAPARGTLRLGALAAPLSRHAVWIIAGFVAAAAVALWLCRDIEVDEGVRRQFDPDSEIARTMEVLERELDGVRPVELFFSSRRQRRMVSPEVMAALDTITAWTRNQPEVISVVGFPDLLREARFAGTGGFIPRTSPLATAQPEQYAGMLVLGGDDSWLAFADRRFSRARISLGLRDVGSKATLALVDRLRDVLARELEGIDDIEVQVTGEGYASSLGLEALIHDLAWSLGIAVLGIFGFLALVFRSVRIGLLSLPSNVTPLLFGFAYMTLRGIPLATATVIVASVALGLAVDGTIHVIARYREELATGGDREGALERALDGTGRAVVATCFTLIAGFGILGASSFVPVRHFGELIAVNIGACLVCQILLLPPLLHLAAPRAPVDLGAADT